MWSVKLSRSNVHSSAFRVHGARARSSPYIASSSPAQKQPLIYPSTRVYVFSRVQSSVHISIPIPHTTHIHIHVHTPYRRPQIQSQPYKTHPITPPFPQYLHSPNKRSAKRRPKNLHSPGSIYRDLPRGRSAAGTDSYGMPELACVLQVL